MDKIKIGLIIGSLREKSYSRKLAHLLISIASSPLDLELIELGDLPMYNQDLEDKIPAPWYQFRNQIRSCKGIIFITPEYNRSVPGVLKNAIDVGSRPVSENVWNGKPAAIISISQGNMGGFGANHHLRQCLVFVNVTAMTQPEAYIGKVDTLFNEQGQFKNEDSLKFLHTFLEKYKDWLSKFTK